MKFLYYGSPMNYQEEFRQALINYLKPLGRGGQTELSRKSGISVNIICSIVNGRRTASEKTKNTIIRALGYSYDGFLTFGRGYSLKQKIIPIRRRRDTDPKFARAVALLEEIYDLGKESRILDQIVEEVHSGNIEKLAEGIGYS